MNKPLLSLMIIITSLFTTQLTAHAQDNFGFVCKDNRQIVRCQTYDCPLGDTNKDGRCTLEDDSARLTDARNNPLCANPPSGCGEVLYFAVNDNSACGIRVKQERQNCELFQTSELLINPSSESSLLKQPETLECINLSVSAFEGNAPLTVDFSVQTSGNPSQFEFNFGDSGSPVKLTGSKTNHTYDKPGVYKAHVRVSSDGQNFVTSPSCSRTIIVRENLASQTKGGTLPKTGIGFSLAFLLGFGTLFGVFLFEKFNLG